MVFSNLHILGQQGIWDLHIRKGMIDSISEADHIISTQKVDFTNAHVFPGLINSHDHLDFNCFPSIGNRIYNNYAEWGKDIHQNNKKEIDAVLKIPRELRVAWGVYKNLLGGVTTVVNHGEKLLIPPDFISVVQDFSSLHSFQFEKYWRLKLNNPFSKNKLFVIHAGEGTTKDAHEEINALIRWNTLRKKLIAIHGVAMNEKQAAAFEALVWCPYTNMFLLAKTADINLLKNKTPVIFGTDSTLTASWNIWDHLRLARKTQLASDNEIFNMLNVSAAKVWRLPSVGQISPHFQADIVIMKKKNIIREWDGFFDSNPEDILLALKEGRIILFDEVLLPQLKENTFNGSDFTKINMKGRIKYIQGNLHSLVKNIQSYYPDAVFPFTQ